MEEIIIKKMAIKGREDYFLLQSIPSQTKLSRESGKEEKRKNNAPSSAEAVKAAARSPVDNLFSLFTQSGVLCVSPTFYMRNVAQSGAINLSRARGRHDGDDDL